MIDELFKDVENYRLPQDFLDDISTTQVVNNIPIKKPDKQTYFQIHPNKAWVFNAAVIEMREYNETFIVNPSLTNELINEIVLKSFFLAIDRSDNLFLWSIRLPDSSGRLDTWNRSALRAVEVAKSFWIRLGSNRTTGSYDTNKAEGDLPQPIWPNIEFNTILDIAFKDRYIDNLDHPIIRGLRGLE